MANNLCIYHSDCADGFAAATIVSLALSDSCTFHPGIYQEPAPYVTDKDVIIVDFSYKRPILLTMAEQARSILILDHHKSAKEDLIDLPSNVKVIFDMERSGAMITWDYYFPNEKPPQVLLHIQDYDLWKFALPDTKEIASAVYSYPYDFIVWKNLLFSNVIDLYVEGRAISRNQLKSILELIKIGTYRTLIAGYHVPIINAPYCWASDIGHILGKNEPFAASYYDTSKERVFSLRSSETGEDVAKIAERFNGGGHAHSSGFKLPLDKLDHLSNP